MSTAKHSKWAGLFRNPLGTAALVLLALITLTAILAPILFGHAAETKNLSALQQAPSPEHLLGTDALGRDLLARVLVATRLSVLLALLATAIGLALGIALGLLPLVLPRRASRLLVSAIDLAIAFPALLLALFFAVIFGVGMVGAVLAIAIAIAPGFARLTFTLGSSIMSRDYVSAARVSGASRVKLLTRHVLPNIGDPLAVNGSMIAGDALLSFSALSFLGIGLQPPQYDWGRIFNEGLPLLFVNPVASIGPGVAILIAVLAFNLLGEAAAGVLGTRRGVAVAFLPGVSERAKLRLRSREAVGTATAEVSEPDPAQSNTSHPAAVLEVDNLEVTIPTAGAPIVAVRGVSFRVTEGEAVGLVGESGSGKSTTALAAAGLLSSPAVVSGGKVLLEGNLLDNRIDRATRKRLAERLAFVFQDPMTSFNPTRRMGSQLAETAREHFGMNRKQAWDRAVDRLRAMRLRDPELSATQLPHEFSGGMRQRAMIGLGLMGNPALIIADEPTSALDVTVQEEVLQLLGEARRERGAALLLISHDLELVAAHCSRVLVMYAGRIVEDLPTSELAHARHPYTRALLGAVPRFDTDRSNPIPTIEGRPPRLDELGEGCAFADRCAFASAICRERTPQLVASTDSLAVTGAGSHIQPTRAACWHPVTVPAKAIENGEARV